MSVELHYQSLGEGNPLYILHGLFGSHRNWNGIARKLSESFRVIPVDLRNHGNSGHADSMDYHEMAEDIHQLTELLGHDAIHVIGHSMGGKTAMALSLLNPELVQRLVVVDIAPATYQSNHDELIHAMRSLPLADIQGRNEADALLAEEIDSPILRQFLLQNLVRGDKGFRWRINLEAIHKNHVRLRQFPEELADRSFHGPTLFISGQLSDYIRPEHQPLMDNHFPNARHSVIADANHWVHADKPEHIIREVTAFLE